MNVNIRKYVFPALWGFLFFLVMMPWPKYDAHFFFVAFNVLSLGCILRFAFLQRGMALFFPRSGFLLCLMAFWAASLLSVVNSEVPFISYIYFCFHSILPLSFIFVVLEKDKEPFFKQIYAVALGFFAVIAVSSLVQYFFMPDLLYYGLVHLPMANPNSLAGILSLGFYAFYFLMIGGDRRLYNNAGLIGGILCVGAMLSTGSRGGVLALLVGVIALAFFVWPQVRKHWRCHLWLVAGAGIFFGLLTYFDPANYSQTPWRVFGGTVTGEMAILSERAQIWASSWAIIQQNFWSGIGVGNFFMYYPAFRTESSTAGLMGHSDPLQFWVEMGVAGPVLFYGMIVFAAVKTWACLRGSGVDALQKLKILIPFFAMFSLVLHTHISFHFYVFPLLFLMGALLAYWFVQVQAVVPSGSFVLTKGSDLENRLVKAMLMVLVICQCFLFVHFQGSEIVVRHAKEEVQLRNNLEGFIDKINFASSWSFRKNGRAMALAATVPSGVLRTRKSIPKDEELRLFRQARGLLEDAIYHNPRMASFYYELSIVSEYGRDHLPEEYEGMDAPLALMEIAVGLNPLHANTRLRYAELLIADGKHMAAYDVLKAGVEMDYPGQDARLYFRKLADMAAQAGDFTLQEKALHQGRRWRKSKAPQNLKSRLVHTQ